MMRYQPPKKRFAYGELIRDSMRITWRHKFLWFFALFAGGTSSGSFNYSRSYSSDSDTGTGPSLSEIYQDVSDWVHAHLTLIIAIVIVVIVLSVLWWLWSLLCRGAVIGSVRDIREGRKPGFKSAFASGWHSLARLVLYELFLLLIFFGLAVIAAALILLIIFLIASGTIGRVIVAVMGVSAGSFFVVGLGYLACCGLIVFIAIPWTLFLNLAIRAVILERQGPVGALRRAWRLTMDNLTHGLLVALIAYGLALGAGLALTLVVGVMAIPAIIAWIVTAVEHFPVAGIAVSSLLTLIPVAGLAILSAAMNTYFQAYWTIAYRKFTGQEEEPGPAAPVSPAGPPAAGPGHPPYGPYGPYPQYPGYPQYPSQPYPPAQYPPAQTPQQTPQPYPPGRYQPG